MWDFSTILNLRTTLYYQSKLETAFCKTYRFALDKNHYIYQKLNAWGCHPCQHLEEAFERNQLSNSHTPYQLAAVLLFCFRPSFFLVNRQLQPQPQPGDQDIASSPVNQPNQRLSISWENCEYDPLQSRSISI